MTTASTSTSTLTATIRTTTAMKIRGLFTESMNEWTREIYCLYVLFTDSFFLHVPTFLSAWLFCLCEWTVKTDGKEAGRGWKTSAKKRKQVNKPEINKKRKQTLKDKSKEKYAQSVNILNWTLFELIYYIWRKYIY